jgi:hypothetical protein
MVMLRARIQRLTVLVDQSHIIYIMFEPTHFGLLQSKGYVFRLHIGDNIKLYSKYVLVDNRLRSFKSHFY